MSEDIVRKFTAYSQARQTLPKTRQIVMLYEGMIRFMRQAKDAIAREDIEERYNAITKVSQVITGLHSSLDWAQGGEIARILDGFYSTLYAELNEIQRTGSAVKCDHVISELSEMLNSWVQIDMANDRSDSPAKEVSGGKNSSSDISDSDDKVILAPSDEFIGKALSV